MARYDSENVNQPGQYPAPAWTQFGLAAQDEGTGAGGHPDPSNTVDKGHTNEPGQYPAREGFTGVPLGGTGAPGTAGAPGGVADSGPDAVTWSKDTVWKSEYESDGMTQGSIQHHAQGHVSGKGDWTQANSQGYQAPARLQMPGTAQVQLDAGGDGKFQPGAGRVRRGGFMNGQRG